MNPKDILNAMNDIDGELLETPGKSRRPWIAVAAVVALLIAPVLLIPQSPARTPKTTEPEPPATDASGRLLWVDNRERTSGNAISQELALIYPWEYLTVSEKYPSITLEGVQYSTRAQVISEAKLGDLLGTCEGCGYDIYEEKEYTQAFEVRAINGISPELLVAVKLEDYYVFRSDTYAPSATLGELMDSFQLTETLSLDRLYENQKGKSQDARVLDAGSGEKILQMLAQCPQAPWQEWPDSAYVKTHYVSFSISSQALGISNHSLSVTEEGLVMTNLAEWGYCYRIGEEAAKRIIEYALQNSAPWDEASLGTKWLAGNVTEVGDGYIKIDDSVMLKDPNEGMEFTVITEKITLRRVVEFAGIREGDFVAVRYTDILYADEPLVIREAVSLDRAVYADGQALIPE